MITYELIIQKLKKGESVRSIAKQKLAGRHKIERVLMICKEQGWLADHVPIPTEKELKSFFGNKSKTRTHVDLVPYLTQLKGWILEGHQLTTIYQRLRLNFGYAGSYDAIKRYARKIKADMPPTNLTTPLHFKPGEAAQVDFGHGPKLYDDRTSSIVQTYFFVMTLCYSRHQFALLVTHQDMETWLFSHQKAFHFFGGFPNKIIIDNAKCAVTKACYHEAELNKSYLYFAKEWGFQISPCAPYDPQKKGRVESGVKYVKKGFLPLRQFKDLNDANSQLQDWVLNEAGQRVHGSTYLKPLETFESSETLNPLPTSIPEIAIWKRVTNGRDCHVLYKNCHYSFPHYFFKSELWVKQMPSSITIYSEGEAIAHHPRLFVKGAYSTNENHRPPKAEYFLKRTKEWCVSEAGLIGQNTVFVIESMITDPVQDLLRAAQGVIKLGSTFSKERLEKACARAISFNSIHFKTIKQILEKGIDQEEGESNKVPTVLSRIYQGEASFQRIGYATYQTNTTYH